jgi:hypothetical protein
MISFKKGDIVGVSQEHRHDIFSGVISAKVIEVYSVEDNEFTKFGMTILIQEHISPLWRDHTLDIIESIPYFYKLDEMHYNIF